MRNKKSLVIKLFAFSLLSFTLFLETKAQSFNAPTTLWANHPDGHLTGNSYPDISSDGNGNTYVTGGFDGALTFATLPSPTVLTSAGGEDVFIAKYDATGNVVWAKQVGGTNNEVATAIKYDGFGNIYVIGDYSTSTNFDGTILSNSASTRNNIFIAKFNASNGNLLWVKQGSTGSCCIEQNAIAIAVDNSGNAYITGAFSNITFDPLPTIYAAGASPYNGGWPDIFVVKYSSDGVPQWQTSAGTNEPSHSYNFEQGNSIAVDASGNVYVTGCFNGSSSNPTHFGNINLVSDGGGGFFEGNFFLAKYNQSTSNWEWAMQGGGTANDYGKNVSLDNLGNVYVSGYFEGTGTFGSTTVTASSSDYFVAKYSNNGNQLWIHPVEGVGTYALSSSKVDANGNFYFAGTFGGAITIGDQTVNSNGYDNFYVSAWNSDGNSQWVKHIPGDYFSLIGSVEVEDNGNIDITNVFAGSETFDCTTFGSGSYADLAIAKLGYANSSIAPAIQASRNNICRGNSTTLSISNGDLNNAMDWKWYTGSCGGALVGSGTSITVNPTENTIYYARSEGGCGGPGNCGLISISVDASQPIINSVSAPLEPNPVNTNINLMINNSGNIASTSINWGDNSATQTISNPGNNLIVPHIYTSPGVYTVLTTVTNSCGLTSEANKYQYIVVYDPNGAFVTGGGWINSPAGAYRPNTTLAGKANFGFESKYLKGANVPSGNTEFKFQAGNMNFKSANYQWLVVSGSKAQFKGAGTVNGSGNYGFLLTAVDGDLGSTVSSDLFRIKIWDINNNGAIVYDNQFGSSDDVSPTTQIGSGSIVIHSNKTEQPLTTARTTNGMQTINTEGGLTLSVLPNPSIHYFTLVMKSSSNKLLTVRVTDVLGRTIETKEKMSANSTLQIGERYSTGVYFVEVIQGTQRRVMKLLKGTN